jgi:hypothetical protein
MVAAWASFGWPPRLFSVSFFLQFLVQDLVIVELLF